MAERVGGVVGQFTGAASQDAGADSDAEDNVDGPQQLLLVRLDRDVCTVSLDASGSLLHLRGYRQEIGKAPLRENLAAAVVIATLKDHHSAVIDPMCGSGTIPIETAEISRKLASGRNRGFAFERWPDFEPAALAEARASAEAASLPRAPLPILASDRDQGAIGAATANAKRAGVDQDISFSRLAVSALEPPPGVARGLVVTNPPYGVRVGDRDSLRDLFARFGSVLRERFVGWDVALLVADRRLESQLRLDLREVLAFSNGGIRVRLLAGHVRA
ncbi:MAG: hypothetical protein U0163_09655 [Gemmatimonadaceae bacterium]